MLAPSIFRPYNIRGVYPTELDEDGAYRVAQSFASVTKPKKVAVGRDARLSGPALQEAALGGLTEAGIDVVDLGLITTDTLYYAAGAKNWDGIQVSASHNPPEWNGMKFIKRGVEPLTDVELRAVYEGAQQAGKKSATKGNVETLELLPDYVNYLLQRIDPKTLKPFKVVANPLNGMAGPLVRAIAEKLPIALIPLNMDPDGRFPKGNPDPFLPAMRRETSETVKKEQADFGVSWDNDADRCAFFDETGEFVPGAFTTALLAQQYLHENPGATIISETRVIWPIKETVEAAGGRHVVNKPGHAFLKARMRKEQAVFGGELSGHYFFKDFWYADNGFIPLLIMLRLLAASGQKLSELVRPLRKKYFFSEEINFDMDRGAAERVLDQVEQRYEGGRPNRLSGLSIEYPDWRFNLRPSDNEPKLRLTVEARQKELIDVKISELTQAIRD